MRPNGGYSRFGCSRPPGLHGARVLSAGLLLAWGVALGLSGFGLGHSEAARWFNDYWPLPFLAYGIVGLLWPRAVGLGFGLAALVVAGSVLLLVPHVPVAGLHLAALAGAAVVTLLALLVLTRGRGFRW